MRQVELNKIEEAFFRRFGARIQITVGVNSDHGYRVSSSVFAKRRGVSLLVSQPFRSRLVAKADFDVFATHLINVWKSMSDETVSSALEYLQCYRSRLSVDCRVNAVSLTNDKDSIRRIKAIVSPAEISFRVSKDILGNVVPRDMLDILFCAYGFLFILSGVLSDKEEPGNDAPHLEGQTHQATITYYERSRINRAICIAAHGTTCAVCGMDFEKVYGPFATGYIEVHHRCPVSSMDGETVVNPITDLVPLCPNCHAAVHMEDPPIEPERLRDLISGRAEN